MAHPVHISMARPKTPASFPHDAARDAAADASWAGRLPVRIILLVAIGLASIAATLLTLADLGAV